MVRSVLVATLAAILGTQFIAGSGLSQDGKPKAKFSFFEVTGGSLVVGKSFKIDQAYGDKRKLTVKAPFRFIAPTSKKFLVGLQPTPGTDTLIKIVYATLEKEFIENFQFSTLTVPMGAEEDRLKMVANLLAKQGFAMVVKPYKNPKRDGVRKIKVGPYAAVEVFGRYVDPEHGVMYARLVGIPHPKSKHGIFMVANIASARLPLENPDELATKTRSGAALTTFKYLD